jgi:threonine dehydratase
MDKAMQVDPAGDDFSVDLAVALREAIAPHIRRTPLLRSEWLSRITGGEVYLKCEGLQVTGSFKVRGAFAALAMLPPEKRQRGVLATSAGNHGQGLALAAKVYGVPCTIAVPSSVPRVKEGAILAYGARVLKSPHAGYDDTDRWARERFAEMGGTQVSPFEGAAIVAGNGGTMALEILEELPDLDALVVPCGGGGCVSGFGLIARARSPRTMVFGVNSDASPGMWRSYRDGRAHLTIESAPTIAEGIEGGVTERSFVLARRFVDEILLAPEESIRRAVVGLLLRDRLVVEGSGAAGVAALLSGALQGGKVCVVLTGSNIDRERLQALLAEPQAAEKPPSTMST